MIGYILQCIVIVGRCDRKNAEYCSVCNLINCSFSLEIQLSSSTYWEWLKAVGSNLDLVNPSTTLVQL